MTVTKEQIDKVMRSSWGTENYLHRPFCKEIVYTDGITTLQKELGMFWFVDMLCSYRNTLLRNYYKTNETFYVVELNVKEDKTAIFRITREEYDETKNKSVKKVVARQEIPYTDLPEYKFKFYLELANETPLTFCLLLPSEH